MVFKRQENLLIPFQNTPQRFEFEIAKNNSANIPISQQINYYYRYQNLRTKIVQIQLNFGKNE